MKNLLISLLLIIIIVLLLILIYNINNEQEKQMIENFEHIIGAFKVDENFIKYIKFNNTSKKITIDTHEIYSNKITLSEETDFIADSVKQAIELINNLFINNPNFVRVSS